MIESAQERLEKMLPARRADLTGRVEPVRQVEPMVTRDLISRSPDYPHPGDYAPDNFQDLEHAVNWQLELNRRLIASIDVIADIAFHVYDVPRYGAAIKGEVKGSRGMLHQLWEAQAEYESLLQDLEQVTQPLLKLA